MAEPGQRTLDPRTLGGQELPCPLRIHGATLPDMRTSERARKWARLDSNQGPTDYESAALTS